MTKILIAILIMAIVGGALAYYLLNKSATVTTPLETGSPSPAALSSPVQFPISGTNQPMPNSKYPLQPTLSPQPTTAHVPSPTAPTPTPTPEPILHSVIIVNFAFNQQLITVKKGDTVVWTNKDSAPHTVTGDNGGPASSTISTNGTYSFKFNSVGTFNYHCAIHPSMTGTVVVTQ